MERRAHRVQCRGLLAGLAAVLLAIPALPAHAASCIGVEARVNAETSVLAGAVSGTVGQVQATLLAQAEAEREQLSSALAVLDRQTSLSSDAGVTALTKSFETASGLLVAQWQALAVKEETDRYLATGHDPCALAEKAARAERTLADGAAWRDALRRAAANRLGAERTLATRDAWFRRFREAGGMPKPDDLLSGDRQKAGAWVDFVSGPPEAPGDVGGAARAMRALFATEADLRRSAALEGMVAGSEPSALAEVAGHWSGQDGGMAWSREMAAGDARGTRLDLIQIKAAMAAVQADRLRRRVARLTAMAADAAVRIDASAGFGGTP